MSLMVSRTFIVTIALFLSCLLTGCAVQSRKEQNNIRKFFAKRNYSKALKLLEKSSIKKDKKNKLLYLMEKGRILYASEKYYQASKLFVEANRLVDQLYTKKIREKILSSVGNDNSQTYYGSVFERSMLYYYQAQSFYKLFQNGEYKKLKKYEIKKDDKKVQKSKWVKVKLPPRERSQYLNKARSSIIAWNSFFDGLKRSNSETIYRDDLLGKIFAASIHEAVGFRDRQITLQLYKDARNLLKIQGHSYKSFDKNFKKNTRKLQIMLEGKARSLGPKDIQATAYYQDLLNFLDYKILGLTWKIRRNDYNRLLSIYNPSSSVKARLRKDKKIANISILVEREVIAPMRAKNFEYSLNSAMNDIEDPATKALVEGVGLPIITYFAMGPLGLGTIHKSGNNMIYARHDVGTTMVKHTGIEFEMPMVREMPISKPIELLVYKLNPDNKRLVKSQKMLITSPNHDIALQAANERAAASFSKVGVRVAVKHIVAIVAAYQTFQSMKGKNSGNELIAKTVAFAQYMASAKAIAASEKADIRHWSTLPGVINLADLYLPRGKYEVAIRTLLPVNEGAPEVKLGVIEVDDVNKKNIFSYQL